MHRSSVQRHHSSVLRHSTVLHQSSVLRNSARFHHSSVLHHSLVLRNSSLLHHSSVLRHSSVLHHSLASILCHVIICYTILHHQQLTTDADTPCRLFNCIVEILVLATAAYRTFRPACRRIYSTVKIYSTSFKSMFAALQLNYLSILSTVYNWSSPFGRLHSSCVFLHYRFFISAFVS